MGFWTFLALLRLKPLGHPNYKQMNEKWQKEINADSDGAKLEKWFKSVETGKCKMSLGLSISGILKARCHYSTPIGETKN